MGAAVRGGRLGVGRLVAPSLGGFDRSHLADAQPQARREEEVIAAAAAGHSHREQTNSSLGKGLLFWEKWLAG
jgi:hypothetical protein